MDHLQFQLDSDIRRLERVVADQAFAITNLQVELKNLQDKTGGAIFSFTYDILELRNTLEALSLKVGSLLSWERWLTKVYAWWFGAAA